MPITRVSDVVSWRLCLGCGACQWKCPEQKITLVNVVEDGIRPRLGEAGCESCGECLTVCPGIDITREASDIPSGILPELLEDWGAVLEVWEGYSADPEIRFRGSSGGLATALSLYCLEQEGMHGTLHIGADPDLRWQNRTFLSRSREELLKHTGSRYAPASPCNGLGLIENAPSPCVFVGKPCDVVAVQKSRKKSQALDENLGLTIAIFCAGTPSTLGTLEMLEVMGVKPEEVADLRYRGNGWPGKATVTVLPCNTGIDETSPHPASPYQGEEKTVLPLTNPDVSGESEGVSKASPPCPPLHEMERGKQRHSLNEGEEKAVLPLTNPDVSGELEGVMVDKRELTYQESWGEILQKHRPFRCHLCPDGTGEFADLSCGDPWYREIPPDEPGRSMLIVRTERGREIARRAQEKGYIVLEKADPSIIPRSSGLNHRKQVLWGRLFALWLMMIPYPRYQGLNLWNLWSRQPLKSRLISILGTLKRIFIRKLYRRKTINWSYQRKTYTVPKPKGDT